MRYFNKNNPIKTNFNDFLKIILVHEIKYLMRHFLVQLCIFILIEHSITF